MSHTDLPLCEIVLYIRLNPWCLCVLHITRKHAPIPNTCLFVLFICGGAGIEFNRGKHDGVPSNARLFQHLPNNHYLVSGMQYVLSPFSSHYVPLITPNIFLATRGSTTVTSIAMLYVLHSVRDNCLTHIFSPSTTDNILFGHLSAVDLIAYSRTCKSVREVVASFYRRAFRIEITLHRYFTLEEIVRFHELQATTGYILPLYYIPL